MNFLVHEGYKEGAEMFAKESGVDAQIDKDSIDSRIEVRQRIVNGEIEEAIKLINEMNPEVSQFYCGCIAFKCDFCCRSWRRILTCCSI